MATLADKRFLIVTGKGGVGKTTVCAAEALALAAKGKRVLVAMCNAKERLSAMLGSRPRSAQRHRGRAQRLGREHDPGDALEEYGIMRLKSRALYKLLFDNSYVRTFFRAVPGMQEWAMLGKAWWHTTETAHGRIAALRRRHPRRAGDRARARHAPRAEGHRRRRAAGPPAPRRRARVEALPGSEDVRRRARDAARGDADDGDDRARARAPGDGLARRPGRRERRPAAALLAGRARGARGHAAVRRRRAPATPRSSPRATAPRGSACRRRAWRASRRSSPSRRRSCRCCSKSRRRPRAIRELAKRV